MPVSAAHSAASERVLESAHFINKNSSDVFVPEAGVQQAAHEIIKRMKSTGYSTEEWKKHELTPNTADAAAIEWIFVVDTLNFSFWSDRTNKNEQYTVTLDGTEHRGYWSLCAAINRAINEGIPITHASYYAHASLSDLSHIFRTDLPNVQEHIPMLAERVQCLHETGRVLLEKYGGKFANMLKQCEGSAQTLVEMVVRDFACYRDEHMFQGRRVDLYKRAQILVADIWACFEGQKDGMFEDIDKITMFADYRVPQALCHFGALEYSPRLLEYLKTSEVAVRQGTSASPPEPGLLPTGHKWEVEIRGNSIWAVERICQHIRASGVHVNAILIDFYMWDYAKAHPEAMASIPIHLTRSIFY
ncbi:hypothetical protein IW139_003232 [Coemansia sp. RSA 353]|nr:hypothetical protein LPJ54_005303 [Coemansia sp. RSA 1824]KAJ2165805.1 hypothetical protein GGH15_003148 [Coemansia sp. RSA 562]KAJ2170817.1 hypothetical protein GGF45_005184 [Coemansia sp. RSA 551]KAJ2187611.1 hypothetical protein EV181_002661 [Coemansia sp. RSA 532]KAJ2205441.1 hypothetical protein IW145_002798 [Coemansia sp. RSA 521]KAJ2229982.1 hypothetical protein EV180_001228 [Coemansia sp. RSA 518]KAJ2278730.1 hypothetical protein GGH14_002937 [Coemansia sp. RSA 370]KAJ2296684.1 hy